MSYFLFLFITTDFILFSKIHIIYHLTSIFQANNYWERDNYLIISFNNQMFGHDLNFSRVAASTLAAD